MQECDCFASLLRKTCEKYPGQPLTVVWYTDEVTPGNPLAPDNARKAYLIYITVLEFGTAIRSEFAWLPASLIKHVAVDHIEGGLARVARDVLRKWSPARLFNTGIVLLLGNLPVLVKFRRKLKLLADYAAACAVWGGKTASGIRPCLFCKNCVLKSSSLDQHANPDGYLVSALCCDFERFDVMEPEDYVATARKLEETPADLLLRAEIECGFNYIEQGLLQSELLGFAAPEETLSDGMHNLFGSGSTIAIATGLFVQSLQDNGVTLELMQSLLSATWEKPFMHANSLDSDWRVSSLLNRKKLTSKHYKGGASELISLMPLLEHMAHKLRSQLPSMDLQFEASLAPCAAGHEYLKLKRSNSELDDASFVKACNRQLETIVLAYGETAAKPKHHLCFHIGPQSKKKPSCCGLLCARKEKP